MYIIFISLLCISTSLFSATFLTISESGTYELGDSINFSAASATDSIILINTNNVILDLKNYVLTQSNSGTTMLAGITVASNVSNVKIRNGTINGITGEGVFLQGSNQGIIIDNINTNSCTNGFNIQSSNLVSINNCSSMFPTNNALQSVSSNFVQSSNFFAYKSSSDSISLQQNANCSLQRIIISGSSGNGVSISNSDLIAIDDIITTSCQSTGISISTSTNCYVDKAAIFNCALSAAIGTVAFNISQSYFLNIGNCKLFQNGNSAQALNNFNINFCNQSLFHDIIITTSLSNTSFNGVFIDHSNQLIFENCNLMSSFATNGMAGFFLNSNATTSCIFENCSVGNCVSPNGITGFLMGASTAPNSLIFKGCNILNNQSGPNFTGFQTPASATNGTFISFEQCNIKNNTCTSDTSFFYNINNMNNVSVNDCSIVNNNITGVQSGGGQGFHGLSIINCLSAYIKDTIISNFSSGTNTVVGYDIAATTSCHLIECDAMNGTGPTSAIGFELRSGTVLTNLIRCVSSNQYSTSGAATGYTFITTTSCSAQDCTAIRNNGAGGSVGFNLSGSFNTLIRNTAIGHSSNFSGFNTNNFIVPAAATDTNSTCSPWTNFGITG